MSKFSYLLRSASAFASAKKCPYCGESDTRVIDRKYVVTTLNECHKCGLNFRHPSDSVQFNAKFYQKAYKQNDSITTDLPQKDQLNAWMAQDFKGSSKDYSDKIDLLQSLTGGPSRIVDYGSNWGYTSYQLKRAGFEVQAYEISRPRAEFGKELGIKIETEEKNLKGEVDLFFSAHVIEHVPDIKKMFTLAQNLLAPDGYFVAYCPSGCSAFRTVDPVGFHRFWGEVHPNMLNDEFYSRAFKDVPYLIASNASSPDVIKGWDKKSQVKADLTGSELLVIAKIKGQLF